MGLSKKLGTAGQRPSLSNAVPYKWSTQTYTVEDVLKKFKLPCVVQCATDSCTVVWSDFQFDLRQPLLLYSRRSIQKVHAVSLQEKNEILEELGPPLAIPQDYEGWFGAAPKGHSQAKRHFRVDDVANSTAQRFLVATKCPAFTSSRGVDGTLKYVPRDVMPGEVLRRVCVTGSDVSDSDSPEFVKEYGPSLECLDEKEEDVIIPLPHAALMYEIEESYPDEASRVFQIASLIAAGNSKLPRILTLVHGEPPLLAYAFTGLLRCYSVFTEETILAATLDDPDSRCLELTTDSSVRFRLGLNEAAVKKTCEYTNAFQMCENFGSKFIIGIKVSFSLKPEVSDTDDVDISFCESVSDTQEVEANSEFEIAWGSVKKARLFVSSSDSENVKNKSDENSSLVNTATVEMTKNQDIGTEYVSDNSSEVSAPPLPQNRDFTEPEIVDLMLKKGIIDRTETAKDATLDLDIIKENRVIDNPLFYFFQRNPEQNPWKMADSEQNPRNMSDSKNEHSNSDELQEAEISAQNQPNQENSLAYLFQQNKIPVSAKEDSSNPLAHLFEPRSRQPLIEVSSNLTVLPAECEINASGVETTDIQNSSLISVSDTDDVFQYGRIVCRPAKEYNDNDNENDSNSDIDIYSSNSSIGSSASSLLPNEHKGLYCRQRIYLPDKNGTRSEEAEPLQIPSSKISGQRPLIDEDSDVSSGESSTSDSPVTYVGDANAMQESCEMDDSEDEAQTVHDLLSLADLESKVDSNNISGHVNLSEESSTCSKSPHSRDIDAVGRVNSLLEDVFEIVNESSGRIMNSNKEKPHLENVSIPVKRNCAHMPIAKHTNSSGNISFPTAFSETDFKAGTLEKSCANTSTIIAEVVLPKSANFIDRGDNNAPSSRSHNENRTDSQRRRDCKAKYDLPATRHRSEHSTGALKRASAEVNLTNITDEKRDDNLAVHNQAGKKGSSISSIFSFPKIPENKFCSTKVKHYPHSHPHSPAEEIENDKTHASILDMGDNYSSPIKSQRVFSHHRGNILASVQNLEHPSSVSDSISSNTSSGDSCTSPKLMVIKDNDLYIASKRSFNSCTGESNVKATVHKCNDSECFPFDLDSDGSISVTSTDEDSTNEGRETVLPEANEKYRPDKLMTSKNNFMCTLQAYDNLQEDFV